MARNGITSLELPADCERRSRAAAGATSPYLTGTEHPVPARLAHAIALLLESYNYAQDVGCSVWEFALEIDAFEALGLTASDWRWLCYKGFVDHAQERTRFDEKERSFRHRGVLRLTCRTCFILTNAGEQFARQLLTHGAAPSAPVNLPEVCSTERLKCDLNGTSQTAPTWDRDRQQLRLGGAIVKEFKLPAPNQETILAAFQEENWPPRIDDPLSPHGEVDPKRRLHDTITSLNRNQKQPLIRFLGDGSGQGVRWEFVPRAQSNGKH
ncbi:MAG TPA: hypothetical protein VFI31_29900 [Pirellulales bacterium]|nr:hypothetical protein [Pirellulales bacterium]